MTPAINQVKRARVGYTIHSYRHDATNTAYGDEAVEKLGVAETRVFKTLVVKLENGALAVGVVPVASRLNVKQFAKATGVKKVVMAAPADVERSTGYVLGGVSPLGQKKCLRTLIDLSAQNYATIFVSAGRRGLEIELAPMDLAALTAGRFAAISVDSD